MAANPIFNPFIFLAALLAFPLFLSGLILLRRGRWPRRTGNEPHCPSCDYLLIGLASDRCPECGTSLTNHNIIHGQRHRRPGLAWMGGALILASLLLLSPASLSLYNTINWYHFKPTFFVLRELKSGSFRALNELERREQNNSLSVNYAQKIIDIALQQQGAASQGLLAGKLVDFAGRQFTAGHMTDTQLKLFGHQSVRFDLQVRKWVALGETVPFTIHDKSECPANHWWVRSSGNDPFTIDNKPVTGGGRTSGSASGLGSGGGGSSSIICQKPGLHQLGTTAKLQLFSGTFGDEKTSKLVYEEDVPLSANFEVVASPTTLPVRLINDPKLNGPIQASIQPKDFRYDAKSKSINGTLMITRPPSNVAFDVVARYAGSDHLLGSITMPSGSEMQWGIGDSTKDVPPPLIDIVLRPNEKAARNSVDLYDIWDGELIYPNIPVAHTPTP